VDYNSNKLINALVLTSIIGFIIISGTMIFTFTHATISHYNNTLHETKIQINKNARIAAEDKIQKVVDFVKIYKKTLVKEEKAKVKEKVKNSIVIIQEIYDSHKGFPKNTIIQKIKDRLRDTRFFDNKSGYFFIDTLEGVSVLLPPLPRLEGKNLINFQDVKKGYTIQNMISIVKSQKFGYLDWWWYKPNEKVMKKKIGYVQIFKPLDIYIGTAVYEEDIIHTVKKEIINYLRGLKSDDYGYIFAYDLHKDNYSIKEINSLGNLIRGKKIVKDIVKGARVIPEGFFMHFSPKENKKEFTYARMIQDLSLIIGTRVNNVDELYKKQHEIIKKKISDTLYNTILIALIIFVLMSVLFLVLSGRVKKLFKQLEKTINKRTVELTEQKNMFRTLFNESHDGVILSQNSKMTDCNEATLDIFGTRDKEKFLKIKTENLFPEFQEDGQNSLEKLEAMFAIAKQKGFHEFEIQAQKYNGKIVWLNFVVTKLTLNNKVVGHHIVRDITDKKRVEKEFDLQQEKLLFQANHDPLTSLANRTLLMDRLFEDIKKAKRNQSIIAVLFLDIDNFKNINDVYGHDVGDKLLIEVAKILKKQVRTTDIISRFGGDEFVIVLNDLKNMTFASVIAQKIMSCFHKQFIFENNSLQITFSIGISSFPNDTQDKTSLLKYADIALYKAKANGKNRYQFYNESMNLEMLEHVKIKKEIQKGMENDEFILHYQPQFEVGTQKIVGLEALVRWIHPDKGLIYPDYFIQIAEESDLIIPLGELISQKAIRQISKWRNMGYDFGRMSINFTAKQLDEKDFFVKFEQLLFEEKCDGSCIEAELIERYIMKNIEHSFEILECFKGIGVGIAIDDFGTGYSSLNYLKHIPLTKLKIDKSFIDDITTNKKDRAIAESIINIAKGLDIEVLAEGVETKDQYELLEQMGCEIIQGYYFSKPLPPEEIEKLGRVTNT